MTETEKIEAAARIIDPGSWSVMDRYLAEAKREFAGQNVGWPTEQFQDKSSMDKARAIFALCPAQPILLMMAAASREQEMWERRFQYLCRVFEPDKRFIDSDGKWGLRDFLNYAGEICGFSASAIEAATAGETGNTDSTEGESAAPAGGDAQK